MGREVVLDTETTGLSPKDGHRVIEIGCVELIDRKLTGRSFHYYLNPENKPVDRAAFEVHGISNAFLADKPLFESIAAELVDFISESTLIIHNASFDVGFLNAEFARLPKKKGFTKVSDYCDVFCTLKFERQKNPGQKSNLDAVCKRYNIDTSKRTKHGAWVDAEILAAAYLAMTGGQVSFFDNVLQNTASQLNAGASKTLLTSRSPVYKASETELKAHADFMAFLDLESK